MNRSKRREIITNARAKQIEDWIKIVIAQNHELNDRVKDLEAKARGEE